MFESKGRWNVLVVGEPLHDMEDLREGKISVEVLSLYIITWLSECLKLHHLLKWGEGAAATVCQP